jgi:heptosyltransferase-2
MDPVKFQNIQRILIRAPNWIGDAVMATPAVRAVRVHFPEAAITVLAKPWVAEVFGANPHVDALLHYQDPGPHAGPAGTLKLAKALRKGRFDLAILLQNAFEAAFLAWLAGIPHRLGYGTDGRSLLLSHPVPVRPRDRQVHHIRYYLNLLSRAGLGLGHERLIVKIRPAETVRAKAILARQGVPEGAALLGINPGAAYGSAKRWPWQRYAALCQRLQTDYGLVPLIFGGPGEARLGERIRQSLGGRAANLCGKTRLREAMSLIAACRLFVSNDSGLMHLAAGLNVPLLAIFGPTDPVTTPPVGPNAHIIRIPLPCSPCLQRECPLGHHRCMAAITVEQVQAKARRILEGGETACRS